MLERTRQLVGSEPSQALRYLPCAVLISDVAAVTLAGILAVIGRERLTVFDSAGGVREHLGVVGPLSVVAWIAVIVLFGGYSREIFGGGTDEYLRVFRASVVTTGVLGVTCYVAKFDLSRGFFLLSFLIGLPLLLLGRWALRTGLHSARRQGFLQVRILVSGTPEHVDEVTRVLRRESWLGYSVIGAVTPAEDFADETAIGVPLFGVAADVTAVARAHRADIIFFASGSLGSAQEMRERVWELEDDGINVVIAPSLDDISSQRIKIRPVGGLPLIHVDRPRWSDAARLGKRLFDVLGSGALIVAIGPLFVVAALQIWLHDRGPILFRQDRIGRHGETFSCLKFRTMVTDAEQLVGRLIDASDGDALLFKMKDDPRVTKPGRWMRRYSIDELPQLFNVFRGDMSLVGPRPQVQREVDLYEGGMSRRLLVRPGMTGLWQVSGRSDLSAEEAMRLDLFYVDNWSMLQDLSILARTARAVVGSSGAY
jgi:exopolysaccharide biosynthesis polyprenyl glycosylphosphotransferase